VEPGVESKGQPLQGIKLSNQDEILIEAGKAIILESISVGRDFCKFMVGFATGAVPVYLGLVKLFLPDTYEFAMIDRGLLAAPVLSFMISAGLFVLGYMPRSEPFSVDEIESIEEHRRSSITRRSRLSIAGFVVFALGIIVGAAVVLFVVPDTTTMTS